MVLSLIRFGFGKESTGGILVHNNRHLCFTCEDQKQSPKVMHETCIPAGRYEIKIRDAGAMNMRYKTRYPFHKGMLHLQDVPNFEWIYLHVGNDDDDTSGCILVGNSINILNGEYSLRASTPAYVKIYKLITDAIERGERAYIDVM